MIESSTWDRVDTGTRGLSGRRGRERGPGGYRTVLKCYRVATAGPSRVATGRTRRQALDCDYRGRGSCRPWPQATTD